MPNVIDVANAADMIVDGYAFILREDGISVLNLRHPSRASFLSPEGTVIETSMDDIELAIVGDYLARNKDILEDQDA